MTWWKVPPGSSVSWTLPEMAAYVISPPSPGRLCGPARIRVAACRAASVGRLFRKGSGNAWLLMSL
jgi:hypothetical protein